MQNIFDKLVSEAREARKRAFTVKRGKFTVGAAVLCRSGRIFRGMSVRTVPALSSVCAEQVAVACALLASEVPELIVAVGGKGKKDGVVVPCGNCRQYLYSVSDRISVIIGAEKGLEKKSIDRLLPHPFYD